MYQLKRSKRKTLAIHVLRDGRVEIRAPLRMPGHDIERFVEQKQAWIASARLRMSQLPVRALPCYQWGSEHFFLGVPHVLLNEAQSAVPSANSIRLPLSGSATPQRIESALARWYRTQAESLFAERLAHWHQQLPFATPDPLSLRLRRMRRRWGSCRSTGHITLNTELIRYPLACLDAVIVHELCHFQEMNHSARFYRWMDQVWPDWREADNLLQELAQQY